MPPSDTAVAQRNGNQPAAPLTPAQDFGRTVQALANRGLVEMFGSENGKAAAARVAVAFRAAAASAKDPSALYRCSAESVASCMALSAMTQVMPGGAFPGCYLVPKGGQLGWWISARGIKTLARRIGQNVTTYAYFEFDDYAIDEFEMTMSLRKGVGDRDDYAKLVGIVVLVRDADGQKVAMRDVTKDQIEKRRRKSLQPNAGPWKEWPMEMAEKTAIKFCAARGEIVFDDIGTTTMAREHDAIDVAHVEVAAPRQIAQGMEALDGVLAQPQAEAVAAQPASAEPAHDGPTPEERAEMEAHARAQAAADEAEKKRGQQAEQDGETP